MAVVIDGERCASDGLIFYGPANNVISTEGADGAIPEAYIAQVFVCRTGKILHTRPGGRLGDSPVEGISQPPSASRSWGGDEPLMRREAHQGGSGSSTFREGRRSAVVDRARSSSYVVQSADGRRGFIVNDDPFGGVNCVKVECVESEINMPRPRDSISAVGKESAVSEFTASPMGKREKGEMEEEDDQLETPEDEGAPWR